MHLPSTPAEIIFFVGACACLVAIIGGLCWSIPMYLRIKRETEKKP